MTNLVPGAVLRLEPADWREPTTGHTNPVAATLIHWWRRLNSRPLHMLIERTSWAKSRSDHGIWILVEGQDLDADGQPLGPRTAYVRLAATTRRRPSPPN